MSQTKYQAGKPLALVATCARAMEPLLAAELEALFAQNVIAGDRIVTFEASPEVLYKVLLNVRTANRVLWPLVTVHAEDGDSLYQNLKQYPWASLLNPSHKFCIDFIGESEAFRNTMFGAQRVKDAIVDTTRIGDLRPNIDKDNPDLRFNAVLLSDGKQVDRVQVAIDLAAGSLHKRGYRLQTGEAPLKETVAAGMLIRAGWPAIAEKGGALFDPFCGSGTLLIEGALMAANIGPGVFREKWGFSLCPWHDEALWQSLHQEVKNKLLNIGAIEMPRIVGSDVNIQVLRRAQTNIDNAGLTEIISVEAEHVSDSVAPRAKTGLIISNPPYGERLNDEADLPALYGKFGERISELHNWQAAVLTSEKTLSQAMGLRSHRSYRFDNGAIPCRMYLFELGERNRYQPQAATKIKQAETQVVPREQLGEAALMLANRLQKNMKQLSGWLKDSDINCYRLYDADMPEYAFAVDVYTQLDDGQVWVHLQEYAPPKTVDEQAASRRRLEARDTVSSALNVPLTNVVMKTRERQKGRDKQYQKQGDDRQTFLVQEHGNRFWVDLQTYLDTGLFLDTRPVRKMLAERAYGKRFLNLFAYTASATVYCANAGAHSSVSVDLSATYTDWSQHNFAANRIDTQRHQLVTADCLQWLEDANDAFDLIYLDPPTFSNSKRMRDTLDVQRDQVKLIGYALDLLKDDGELIFVTNHQRFKLEEQVFIDHGWQPTDITAQTLDKDFQRSKKIHQCWSFKRLF